MTITVCDCCRQPIPNPFPGTVNEPWAKVVVTVGTHFGDEDARSRVDDHLGNVCEACEAALVGGVLDVVAKLRAKGAKA